MDAVALYFGCLHHDGSGHTLHGPAGMYRPERHCLDLPWNTNFMDTGLLTNGKRPDVYDGQVWWTVGGKPALWHAFVWWDRSGDHRGNSNSGFYVRGFDFGQQDAAFQFALDQWPEVVGRQRHPLKLIKREPPR